ERLPDVVVEPGATNLLDIDVVGAAQDVELFPRDLAGATDGQPRAGKRMPADESLRQAELAAERAHLVLEQLAQRLDQLHVHSLGQPADVLMRFYRDRRSAGERHALDHVGVECAPRQKIEAAELLRLRLEDIDEELTDRLALEFGIGDAGKRVEKERLRLHVDERDVVAVAKQRHDFLRLGEPQQSMVDKNAGELLTD